MGVIDLGRTGLTGLSFGSEITDFTISHSNLFHAAIVSGGGSRDPYFYYMAGSSWHRQFEDWGLGGWPEGKASKNWHELSPALNVERVTAPLLCNAAETEYAIGLQFYTSLEQTGRPVELFVYPDELHVKFQPKHRYEIYNRNLDWFIFWLQGKEDPDPTKKEQYERWRKLHQMQERERAQIPSSPSKGKPLSIK
jgi:dipeptidyl aminopeptidase/acylaminoacyl peptidase